MLERRKAGFAFEMKKFPLSRETPGCAVFAHVGGMHLGHLNLMLARAIRLSMIAMIQKRTMILGSAHPFNSKWW